MFIITLLISIRLTLRTVDYVSYMTTEKKNLRHTFWKSMNFAGTIDWSVDLQAFTAGDMNTPPDRPTSGIGCTSGRDNSVNTGDLCELSCNFGCCPESLCSFTETGTMDLLPPEKEANVVAWDEFDVDANRLCKFACKYGFCPQEVCTIPETVEWDDVDDTSVDE